MDLSQFLGFLLFLAVFTMGFWLLIFLATFVIPYWIIGYIKEAWKYRNEDKVERKE